MKAYEDAQAAVTKQEGVVEGKLNAYNEAVEAERAAELIYLADPDDATKKAAWESAKTATGKALNEYNAEVATLSTKMGDLATAKAAYDAVNDPYEAAVEELKALEENAAGCAESLTQAEAELEKCKAEVEQLKQTKTLADEAVKMVEAQVADAKAAYDAYLEGTDPEEKALIDNLAQAVSQRDFANEVYSFVYNEYLNITNSYGYYYWYTEYVLNEDYEYSDVNYLANLKNQLVELDKDYEQTLKQFAEAEAEIAKIEDVIEHYKAIEPVYNSWLVDRSAARTAYIEAYKEYIDAQNVEAEVEAKADALRTLISKYIYTDGDDWYDTLETIDIINEINAEIAAAEEELAEIQADMEMNYVSDEYNITVYANILAKIEKLESKIEVYSALAEFYWAQIEEAMGGANVE